MKIVRVKRVKKIDAEPAPATVDIRKPMADIIKEFANCLNGLQKWQVFLKTPEAKELYGEAAASDELYNVNLQINELKKTILPLANRLAKEVKQFDGWLA